MLSPNGSISPSKNWQMSVVSTFINVNMRAQRLLWKAANYAEAIRYRTVALADGAAQNWNGGNILCAALCAERV